MTRVTSSKRTTAIHDGMLFDFPDVDTVYEYKDGQMQPGNFYT